MKVRGQRVLDPKERLMSFVRVNPDTGCWEWMGAKKGKAKLKQYGSLVVGSRSSGGRKTVSAHRYAYEVFIGPIPPGLWVLHKCDNPPCINPDHLFLGDRMDNTRDRDSKGRNKIMYADMNGQALLTNEQVISIRSEFVPRVVTKRMLAYKYGVAIATIKNILMGRTWRSLLPAAPKDNHDATRTTEEV